MKQVRLGPTAAILALSLAAVTPAKGQNMVPVTVAEPAPAWNVDAPYAGLYNHSHAAPSFRWGWFGAERFESRVKYHRGYYGDFYRWNRR